MLLSVKCISTAATPGQVRGKLDLPGHIAILGTSSEIPQNILLWLLFILLL